MTIVIRIYLLICMALICFDIAFLCLNRRRKYVAYQIDEGFAREIAGALAERRATGQFPQGFADSLERRLSSVRNLLTLQQAIEGDAAGKAWFQPYIWAQLGHYAQKNDAEQAYYAYLLSTLDYSREKPKPAERTALLGFLESSFFYTFANTMLALYAIGDATALLWAVQKADAFPGFYHKKLLLEGLLAADTEETFAADLQAHFADATPELQACLLHYFRRKGADATALCLRLLQEPHTEQQVRYAALRYFLQYPHPQAREQFLKILAEDKADWLEQMLALRALEQEEGICAAFRGKYTDPYWYERMEGACYQAQSGLSQAEIAEILRLYARYANAALWQRYRADAALAGHILDIQEMPDAQAYTGVDEEMLYTAAELGG